MAKLNLPTSVKVGAWNYQIELWDTNEAIGQAASAECSTMAKIIHIRESDTRKRAAQNLLHEILHAVYYEWNMSAGDAQERVVSTMADGLAAVWHDNPGVMRWIASGLARW